MKKRFLALIAALAILCSVPVFAGADEADPGISVQLNGQNLVFTDAVPQVRDNRTFLPYRAVFEAMGAEVSGEGNVVTAVRGDTTLSMTIGETTATVTSGGDVRTVTMDVAPYVDETTWRTYVPVRFAADAFGCNVGWDQAAMTAVIVDVDQLVDEAMDGKEFTVLEKFMDYSQKYNTGIWAMDGSFNGAASMMSVQVLTLDGTISGTVADSAAGEMTMTMHLDMSGLADLVTLFPGASLEDAGMSADDMVMDFSVDVKMDLESGRIYMKLNDEINEMLDLPAGVWLSMDFAALMESAGMDWDLDALMGQMQMDVIPMLKTLLAGIPLDSTGDYAELAGILNTLVTLVSDEGFQKTASGYETTLNLEQDGVVFTVKLALDADQAGSITGYSMAVDFKLTPELDDEDQASIAELLGTSGDALTMSMNAGLDKDDVMTAEISLSVGALLSLDMDMNVTYQTTDQAPDTELPEGAEALDYLELLYNTWTPVNTNVVDPGTV